MDPDHERSISQGLRDGRAESWSALYEAHAENLWRWVARRMGGATFGERPGIQGGRAADVADVVQETFLAAARSARHFDATRGSLWTWLVGIARNHVALHYRKEERHSADVHAAHWRSAGDGRLQRWLEGEGNVEANALEAAEMSGLIRVVLERLPPVYESLLSARYLDGVTVEQLADDDKTTVTAIRSKLARARQAFRDALAGMSDQILEAMTGITSDQIPMTNDQ